MNGSVNHTSVLSLVGQLSIEKNDCLRLLLLISRSNNDNNNNGLSNTLSVMWLCARCIELRRFLFICEFHGRKSLTFSDLYTVKAANKQVPPYWFDRMRVDCERVWVDEAICKAPDSSCEPQLSHHKWQWASKGFSLYSHTVVHRFVIHGPIGCSYPIG